MSRVYAWKDIWNTDTLSFLLALPLGYCTSSFQVFSVDTAGFTLTDIGMFLLILFAVYRAVTGQKAMVLKMDLTLSLLGIFFLIALMSAVNPLSSGQSAYVRQYCKSTAHFSYMWLFAVCCASIRINLNSILHILRVYVYCAIPINLFGIYQVPARAFDWPLAWIKFYNESIKSTDQLSLGFEGFFRATSVFSEPSALASFTILSAIILLVPYLMFNVRIVRSKFVFYLCLYSTFVTMFLTFSLTIVAQLSAFLVALIVISRQSNFRKVIVMVGIMTTLFALSNKAISYYADADIFDLYYRRIASNIVGEDKIQGTVGDSFSFRAESQKAAIEVWKKVPWFGTGFGCLYYVTDQKGERELDAFQIYLYTLATTGVLGGCCLSLFMMSMSVMSIRLFLRYQRVVRPMNSQTILVAILPFLCVNQTVIGLSSDNLITPYYWVVIGIIMAIYYHPDVQTLRPRYSFRFIVPSMITALRGTRRLDFGTSSTGLQL